MDKRTEDILFPLCGWLCVGASSVAMFLSASPTLTTISSEWWFLISRTCGMGSFLFGVVNLIHGRWTHATLLFIASIVLPMISLLAYGKL